jgi:putative tryptophan/tyrosine transport system substrate-binding protein
MRRRRAIIMMAGAAFPLPVRAATARIGILNFANPEPLAGLLRQGLRDVGYREGDTLQIEFRTAAGDSAAVARLAAELVRAKVDLIVAYPSPAVAAAKQATRDIPIIMLGAGDPAATGLVASLARPGGNVTGTSSTTPELGTKTLGVMRDIVPSLARVGVLAHATDPFTPAFLAQVQQAGATLRLDMRTIMIGADSELEPALAGLKKEGMQAVMVQPSLPRADVAALALKHRLPAIAPTRPFAVAGGLAAYSPDQHELGRLTAAIVDKVLKGRKPADIPVEQPTRFELVINLKTARAIGLEVPRSVLDRADEVIE